MRYYTANEEREYFARFPRLNEEVYCECACFATQMERVPCAMWGNRGRRSRKRRRKKSAVAEQRAAERERERNAMRDVNTEQ